MSQPCAYCGLPIPAPRFTWRFGGRSATVEDPAQPEYCCFGCRFAAAVAGSSGEEGQQAWTLARLGLSIFLALNVMAFTMALWSQDIYEEEAGHLASPIQGLFRYLCFFFALPVLFLLGGPLLENTWSSLRRGEWNMDVLLLLGVGASYLYSIVSVLRDGGAVYFEVGCMVLVLVTLGRWLEANGKLQATRALDALQKLLPERARVVRDGTVVEVARHELRRGDSVRVAAGERIPCDGTIVGHAATVDEQVLTGESAPRSKEAGERVHGGTMNLEWDLMIEAIPGAAALDRMVELVRQARLTKGRHELLADRVTAWFLPAVMLAALTAGVAHSVAYGIEQGILTGLAVVLIACPCALGIATPLAVWAALGRAAQHQVLFQNSSALERLASVRVVCFDKTGTLTTGEPHVSGLTAAEDEAIEVLRRAAAMAATSRHALSRAVTRFAARAGVVEDGSIATRLLPGRGLEAISTEGEIYLGSWRLMQEKQLAVPDPITREVAVPHPTVCIGWAGHVRGVFRFQEELRNEASSSVKELRAAGLHVEVLTGDHRGAADVLAAELDVAVDADLLPEDKVHTLARLREKHGIVAMVGDGINDAPVLAAADVGIAMGCGADIARDSASVCLLGNDLLKVPWAIGLARRAVRVIRQNLFWAFVYNVGGIALACTGRLNPVLAALAMVVSSLFVVTNSLRLRSDGALAMQSLPLSPSVSMRVGLESHEKASVPAGR